MKDMIKNFIRLWTFTWFVRLFLLCIFVIYVCLISYNSAKNNSRNVTEKVIQK